MRHVVFLRHGDEQPQFLLLRLARDQQHFLVVLKGSVDFADCAFPHVQELVAMRDGQQRDPTRLRQGEPVVYAERETAFRHSSFDGGWHGKQKSRTALLTSCRRTGAVSQTRAPSRRRGRSGLRRRCPRLPWSSPRLGAEARTRN